MKIEMTLWFFFSENQYAVNKYQSSFKGNATNYVKFIWNEKDAKRAQENLENSNSNDEGGLVLPAQIIKIVGCRSGIDMLPWKINTCK